VVSKRWPGELGLRRETNHRCKVPFPGSRRSWSLDSTPLMVVVVVVARLVSVEWECCSIIQPAIDRLTGISHNQWDMIHVAYCVGIPPWTPMYPSQYCRITDAQCKFQPLQRVHASTHLTTTHDQTATTSARQVRLPTRRRTTPSVLSLQSPRPSGPPGMAHQRHPVNE